MIDITHLRSRLEADLGRITEELEAIATYDEASDNWEAVPDNLSAEADINVEADAVEEWNERRATVSALETEYRDIKRALHNIVTAAFGVCEICGEPIEAARLAVKPTARTCSQHMNEESQLSL
jgi:DnaK suppressor protein